MARRQGLAQREVEKSHSATGVLRKNHAHNNSGALRMGDEELILDTL
jgi:hypothetical protein